FRISPKRDHTPFATAQQRGDNITPEGFPITNLQQQPALDPCVFTIKQAAEFGTKVRALAVGDQSRDLVADDLVGSQA
ncbi:MAG: hypothetical protein ACI91B_003340, partial [Planctomycetota bacterium]